MHLFILSYSILWISSSSVSHSSVQCSYMLFLILMYVVETLDRAIRREMDSVTTDAYARLI
jgi:hypothetical protein